MAEAAATLGVEPAQIAKTRSLRVRDTVLVVVTSGDARVENRKFKDTLGARPRMLGAQEVEGLTGHPIGGVCPFGLAAPLPIYCGHLAAQVRSRLSRGGIAHGFSLPDARPLCRADWRSMG